MTTEIAILNKSGVALAADSAVTISMSDGETSQIAKIYANANKLFELVRGRPVGLMVYNNADVSNVPWETLVKSYRESPAVGSTDKLRGYADGFLGFVERTLLAHLTEGQQQLETCAAVRGIVRSLLGSAEGQLKKIEGKVNRRNLLKTALDGLEASLSEQPLQTWAQDLDEHSMWLALRPKLIELAPTRWCETSLPSTLRAQLGRLGLALLLREAEPRGPWSGIVIAGFGDVDLFPSLFHLKVSGVVAGRLRWLSSQQEDVTVERPAIIQPYAQTSEAVMFLQGIDPEVSEAISTFWHDWSLSLAGAASRIAGEAMEPTAEKLESFVGRMDEYMEESWRQFGDFMEAQYHRPRMEPIEASASFLSKGEIADLAENLVELTSLRNRVSLDRQETVGGATDVAVISKGDGFVWVKRKHYFDRDRNPTWAFRQTLRDVLLTQPGSQEGSSDASSDTAGA